jgi:RND family efflux transporter MFP subunit
MKLNRTTWTLAASLVGLAILGALWFGLRGGKAGAAPARTAASAAQPASAAAGVTPAAPAAVELLAQDLAEVRAVPLARSISFTGTLKAASSAVIKAKVPGELVLLAVREGEAVNAGQVVARIDDAEYKARVAQARNTFEAARAQADIAQRTFDNNRALVDKEFISRTALDTSQNALESAKANAAAARAALDLAEKALADTVLRSPIAGQVAQRAAQQGEKLGTDARIVEVVDLRSLEVEAAVPTSDIGRVRVGQTARLRVDGIDELLAASVARINPSAAANSRSVSVYLRLERLHAGLRQGMFAQGVLNTGAQQPVLALPSDAVRTDQPRPYAFVLAGQRIERRVLELGGEGQIGADSWVEVRSGLAAGDKVVRASAGRLQEGAAARVAPLKS